MNRRLALYLDKEFMMAGVKPFTTFTSITVKGYDKIPLYFFVDTSANKIYYGDRYKHEYEDGVKNTFGDFLNSILDERNTYQVFTYTVPVVELLKVVMDDIRREYLSILGELTQSLDPSATIPVSLSFSDNISEPSRKVVGDYLRKVGYDVDTDAYIPSEMLMLSLLESGKLATQDKKVVVMEAFNEDLNYSLIQCYNASTVERIVKHTYPFLGVDSRVNVVSTYTVNYINRQRRLLSDKAEIEKEYKRHFRFAKDWIKQMDNDSRPFVDVKSGFALESSVDNKVVLKKDEIEQLVAFHIRHISKSFELFLENNDHRPEDIDKIVLIGESLRSSDDLRLEFARFGVQKILICDALQERGILNGIFLRKQFKEKPETAPKQSAVSLTATIPDLSTAPTPARFEQVLVAAQLTIGTQLELGWNDRLVKVLYIGNNTFIIVQHHKSQIITGDQFQVDTFILNQRPVFKNVQRSGKSMGDYTPGGVLNVLKRV